MKYIYFLIVVLVVLFVAYYFIPIAFFLIRLLIGVGIIAIFSLGFWVRGLFIDKPNK